MKKCLSTAAAAGGCAMLLAACTSSLDRMQRTQAQPDDAFARALTQEYRDLAAYQWQGQHDWGDANYFARKAMVTARGETPPPEMPRQGWSPRLVGDDLEQSRAQLVSMLQSGATTRAPQLAARAQSRYDCWVENASDPYLASRGPWLDQKVRVCRDEFFASMTQLQAAMQPPPAPVAAAPPLPREQSMLLFFEFDRAEITPEGQAVIRRAAEAYRQGGTPRIVVTGHADRAGPPDYNQSLSERRATAVRQALTLQGVPTDTLATEARGEAEPLVPTPDGVAEPQNRRTEIVIR
jgi:OOP family OmpA-OmpF porin